MERSEGRIRDSRYIRRERGKEKTERKRGGGEGGGGGGEGGRKEL